MCAPLLVWPAVTVNVVCGETLRPPRIYGIGPG
jgi:hypothetical protein